MKNVIGFPVLSYYQNNKTTYVLLDVSIQRTTHTLLNVNTQRATHVLLDVSI